MSTLIWDRIDQADHTGYSALDGRVEVTDNGAGMGSAAGAGRWAVTVDGEWIANIDYLADAKARGLAEAHARRPAALRGQTEQASDATSARETASRALSLHSELESAAYNAECRASAAEDEGDMDAYRLALMIAREYAQAARHQQQVADGLNRLADALNRAAGAGGAMVL